MLESTPRGKHPVPNPLTSPTTQNEPEIEPPPIAAPHAGEMPAPKPPAAKAQTLPHLTNRTNLVMALFVFVVASLLVLFSLMNGMPRNPHPFDLGTEARSINTSTE